MDNRLHCLRYHLPGLLSLVVQRSPCHFVFIIQTIQKEMDIKQDFICFEILTVESLLYAFQKEVSDVLYEKHLPPTQQRAVHEDRPITSQPVLLWSHLTIVGKCKYYLGGISRT